jgi:hypothetical protein
MLSRLNKAQLVKLWLTKHIILMTCITLLCRQEWIEEVLQQILNNDGAQTLGVDGMSWKGFNDTEKSDFENEKFRRQFIAELQEELKARTFQPKLIREEQALTIHSYG